MRSRSRTAFAEVLQPLAGGVGRGQQPGGHVRIAPIGGVDEDTPHETRRVNEEMALAPCTFFGPSSPWAPIFRWFAPSGPR